MTTRATATHEDRPQKSTSRDPAQSKGPHAGGHRQLISFVVAGETFGVDVLSVQEIIRPLKITELPHAPDFVEGIINLRGRVLPVVDLRIRFGDPERPEGGERRILVVETASQTVGFITDAVREVQSVDLGRIEPAPELATGGDAEFVSGVAKQKEGPILILLDLEEVLSAGEVADLRELSEAQPANAPEAGAVERDESEAPQEEPAS